MQHFPHLIVGYSPWKIEKTDTKYSYASDVPTENYNIMLSDAFLIHKRYLTVYTKKTPSLLYNEIHSHYNGDRFSRDVLMNLIVAEALKKEANPQSPCLWVKADSFKLKSNFLIYITVIKILLLFCLGSVSAGDSDLWNRRNKLLAQIERFYNHDLPLYDSTWTTTHKDDMNVFHRTG